MLYHIILSDVLYYMSYHIILHCITLHYITLHYITLHCIPLHYKSADLHHIHRNLHLHRKGGALKSFLGRDVEAGAERTLWGSGTSPKSVL